ncbi:MULTISPECIES: DUF1579 family protein [unclassified Amycolatopsis]|uniref:DUF1579 family protein n=1 Tax=unclassified Amycolatopsis TaxID=2618356 RepID=UPI001C6A1529|nr:DUF1579 family protein [Amycolatopsis sp. DSM 110486]QYN23483.1 DUF1579 domain-containing protein [Amycolatopsis sp. DSM 110486]
MEMPRRGDAHEALGALVGDWAGVEELAASPWAPAATAKATASYRAALDGFAVVQEYVQTREDGSNFLGHNVFTVDPATQETLWYGFDSYGFPPGEPGRGGWREGTLHLEKRTPRGVAWHRLQPEGDTLIHEIDVKMGDAAEFSPFLRARYARTR